MIYKRGKGYTYNFRWTIPGADGMVENYRIRRSAKTRREKEAKDIEAAHRLALRLGQVHPKDPWPKPTAIAHAPVFRSFSKVFLRHAQHHVKPGTRNFYEGCLGRLLAFAAIADQPLDAISGDTVSRYASYRIDVAENSVVTVNNDLRTLRRIMNLAVEWRKLKRADAPVIHELPEGEGRDRVLTFKEEAHYLSKASPNLRDAAIIACDTGLRPNSELFCLCWPNVNLTACPETPNGVIHIRDGKSEAAKRSVPLTPRAAEVLKRRKQEAEAMTKHPVFVFPGDGASGHLVSLQHPHEDAIKAAKLLPFQFYCWRHTFGTRCAQAGMDKYTLARFMGHSSPNVTARYYIHIQESHTVAGFAKFAEYQERGIAEGVADAFPDSTHAIQ
jgi:integrase